MEDIKTESKSGFGFASASFLGFQNDTHWSQTLKSANCLVAVEIFGEQAANCGNLFLKEIQAKLEPALPASVSELKKILSEIDTSQAVFNYVCAYLQGDGFYLVVYGNGQAFIKRGEKIAVLKENTGSLSGKVKAGDVILLIAGNFAGLTGQDQIITLLRTFTYEQMAEDLNTKLKTSDTEFSLAGLTIQIGEQVQPSVLKDKGVTIFLPAVEIKSLTSTILNKLKAVKTPQFKKVWLILALGFTLILAIGVGLFNQKRAQTDRARLALFEQATHEYEEGMGLVDLNPVRGRELLDSAKNRLTGFLESETKGKPFGLAQGKQKQEVQVLLDKIMAGIDFSLRKYEAELTPFYELSLLKSGGQGDRLSLYKDALGILDNKNKALYLVSISNKSGKIISGDNNLGQAADLAVHGEDVFVFAGKILKVALGKSALSLVKDADEDWGSIRDLEAYGGNLYLLDSGKNQIWKYPAIEAGFGTKQNYLLADELVDLSQAEDVGIDGSVWVAKPQDLLRFTLGKEDVWQIKGLDSPLGKNLDVYTDDLTKNVYILDKDQKRVVVIDKDGVYLAQYFWKNNIEIADFVTSEVIKKILLLSGGTIYGIELK